MNLSDIKKGDRKTLSKTLTNLDQVDSNLLVSEYISLKNKPQILGLIGTPGSGKSSFLNCLAEFRKLNESNLKIGLLLIDPSHPTHGGALLGDRVRLQDHFLDQKLYIRSISNAGSPDGLHPKLAQYLMLMSLFPFDLICIESVGGGQANTNLKSFVDKLILIFDPHSGDGIQHLKGGVLDVADEVIISKTDLINPILIKQSLHEWTHENINIHSANFLDPNSIKSFAHDYFHKSDNQNSTFKLVKNFLYQEYFSKFNTEFIKYSDNFFKSHKLSDDSIREFRKNFPFF